MARKLTRSTGNAAAALEFRPFNAVILGLYIGAWILYHWWAQYAGPSIALFTMVMLCVLASFLVSWGVGSRSRRRRDASASHAAFRGLLFFCLTVMSVLAIAGLDYINLISGIG